MTHVAVCIVSYRNPDDVARCLAALAGSTWSDFEIFVCENGETEAFAALSRSIGARLPSGQSVNLIDAGANLGFAGGINRCLAATQAADAWWILNPDTEPRPDALALMLARLKAGDCEAVGCTLVRPDGTVQSYGGRWRPWLARAESLGIGRVPESTADLAWVEDRQTYLNGASMLVSRSFVDTVGPMREDYFLYCEEVEWCERARALGFRLGFAPNARVLHHQGTATGAGGELRTRPRLPVYLDERNRMLLTRDRFPALLPIAGAAALARICLNSVRRHAWRQFAYGLAGWWAGLKGLRGPGPGVSA